MPFTLAHPVAVLPLLRPLRGRAVLSALVIGSMAPDSIYWFPTPLPRLATHTLPSLLWFSLPIGIAAFVLFHGWLKRPWIELLPESWAAAVPRKHIESDLRGRRWFDVGICVVIGAATHIFLDAFTHLNGPLTRLAPAWFEAVWFELPGVPIQGYRVLQYTISLGGMALLLAAIVRWRASVKIDSLPLPDVRRTVVRVTIWILAAAWAVSQSRKVAEAHVDSWYIFRATGVQFAIEFIAATTALLICWALLYRILIPAPEIRRSNDRPSREVDR